MEFEKQINIKGHAYSLVDIQRAGVSAIYSDGAVYVRVGEPQKILKDLALHKKMEIFGFPVARLLDEGEFEGKAFFIEASLGARHFGYIFKQETEDFGQIQDKTFDDFIAICTKFAAAQLKTATQKKDFSEFQKGVHLDVLCEELPHDKNKILDAYQKAEKRLSVFPFVVTHGDFTPFNIYPAGVIDIEDSFMGFAGCDLGGLIEHLNWFPESPDYEFYRLYQFTDEQKKKFVHAIDVIYLEHNMPPFSHYIADYNFMRGIWFTVRMNHTPKLQQFRYAVLSQLLKDA